MDVMTCCIITVPHHVEHKYHQDECRSCHIYVGMGVGELKVLIIYGRFEQISEARPGTWSYTLVCTWSASIILRRILKRRSDVPSVGKLSFVCFCGFPAFLHALSKCIWNFSRTPPEFHQNFTGIRQKFTGISPECRIGAP